MLDDLIHFHVDDDQIGTVPRRDRAAPQAPAHRRERTGPTRVRVVPAVAPIPQAEGAADRDVLRVGAVYDCLERHLNLAEVMVVALEGGGVADDAGRDLSHGTGEADGLFSALRTMALGFREEQ